MSLEYCGKFALFKLIKDKIVLIIAHKMRTIANADKVVVLIDGIVAFRVSVSIFIILSFKF